MVELYVHPPPLAAIAGERRWRAPSCAGRRAGSRASTNLRHETLRIDDPLALALLVSLDGSRTRAELATALAARLPESERASAGERLATYLAHFAMHGLLAG
jgi:hypothetical protein